MAETLGSLVDKLTIKDIREFHLCQMIEARDPKFSPGELKDKLALLRRQKKNLKNEIDQLVALAVKRKACSKDEKLKLYNALNDMGRIPLTKSLGEAVSGLAHKNLELWHLEDEARRKDAGLAYIGKIKRKIDLANQQRNDYIDRIDELLEKAIKGTQSIGHRCPE
ncbi:MAG: DUF4254 domain-containing protein [Candidatus Omnitrophica bacterium]|nr:DUF4254 domain-containing protein [Candidatus Omnitrophota bacterium]